MKSMLTWIAAALLLIIMPATAVEEGEQAPDFTLEKLSGGTVTLSELKGKVVYIFWFGYS